MFPGASEDDNAGVRVVPERQCDILYFGEMGKVEGVCLFWSVESHRCNMSFFFEREVLVSTKI